MKERMKNKETIQLVIAWTFVIVFIFTAIITLLSLIGLLKFEDEKQQEKLFYVLIVEIVVVSVGFFKEYIKYTPTKDKNNDEILIREEVSEQSETEKNLNLLSNC